MYRKLVLVPMNLLEEWITLEHPCAECREHQWLVNAEELTLMAVCYVYVYKLSIMKTPDTAKLFPYFSALIHSFWDGLESTELGFSNISPRLGGQRSALRPAKEVLEPGLSEIKAESAPHQIMPAGCCASAAWASLRGSRGPLSALPLPNNAVPPCGAPPWHPRDAFFPFPYILRTCLGLSFAIVQPWCSGYGLWGDVSTCWWIPGQDTSRSARVSHLGGAGNSCGKGPKPVVVNREDATPGGEKIGIKARGDVSCRYNKKRTIESIKAKYTLDRKCPFVSPGLSRSLILTEVAQLSADTTCQDRR
ncbi:hypothetical protein EK904_000051, partial [Melospiza melodia maxima]